VKKSEKEAQERLRRMEGPAMKGDHVAVVGKKGGGLQYNAGQAVPQGRGSGLKDIAAAIKAARAAKKK
jgi:hypothetical protein